MEQTITIKVKDTSLYSLSELQKHAENYIELLTQAKPYEMEQFFGSIKTKDPLKIQNELRNEWK